MSRHVSGTHQDRCKEGHGGTRVFLRLSHLCCHSSSPFEEGGLLRAAVGRRPGVYIEGLGGYDQRAMRTPTLAAKLGTTTHLSALLQKARRLGLAQKELEILAVQRGCRHYSTGSEPERSLASDSQLSNEELAIALLSTALPYAPHSIRCGAAMVASQGNDPRRLARLAVMERSVVPLRHVAEAGKRYEPQNRFWDELLAALPQTPQAKRGVLPHPTRFVAMTGFTRRGVEQVTEWQRPAGRGSAAS